jgi:hypothetical protein
MGIANLTGPRAKLGRAKEHLEALYREFGVFAEQEAKTAMVKRRREEEWDVFYLGPIPAVPLRIALLAGDCLVNLRAVLDHLIWQLVLREDQEPGKHLQFPFSYTPEKFLHESEPPAKRGKKPGSIFGIPRGGDAWTLIEAAQPYHCPQPKHDALVRLAQLANIDKHRTLLVQQAFVNTEGLIERVRIWWESDPQGVPPSEVQVGLVGTPLSPEHPTEILRCRFAGGTHPRVDMEGKIPLEPTIGDEETQVSLNVLGGAYMRVQKLLEQVAALPLVQA